jgi:uncharacterized membrane protein
MAKKKTITLEQVIPWMLIIGGIIGLICSFVLVYDQIRIWENPLYHPACNLNPIVSCGSVINSKQGDVFGIPAPFFGLVVFSVLTTMGVIVQSGVKLKRWLWIGLELGTLGGFLSGLLLFFISIYRVHALCPFCLTVDVVVYTLFWYMTLYCIDTKVISVPKGWERAVAFARKRHLDILVLWFLIVALYTLQHFWYYYGHYL